MHIEESQNTETSSESEPVNSAFAEDFRSVGQYLSEADVAKWLASHDQVPGYEHLHHVHTQLLKPVTNRFCSKTVRKQFNCFHVHTVTRKPVMS